MKNEYSEAYVRGVMDGSLYDAQGAIDYNAMDKHVGHKVGLFYNFDFSIGLWCADCQRHIMVWIVPENEEGEVK